MLAGPCWTEHTRIAPACDECIQRLRSLGKKTPELLVAHPIVALFGAGRNQTDMLNQEFEGLSLSIDDTLATIRLERPEKKNAMSPAMHAGMHAALDRIEEAGTVAVVVLTGIDDTFCGGMDLEKYFLEAWDEPARFRDNLTRSHSWMRRWKTLPAVTVARVNGWCLGGGLLMVCISDIAIAAEDAIFGLSEVNFGIFPAGGTTWGVSRNFATKAASYYMLTGERFDGKKAVELGLVNTSVPRDALDAEVERVTELLRKKDRNALRYTKAVYERVRGMSYQEAQEYEVAMLFDLSYNTGDAWVKRALESFKQRKYRPGFESYPQDKESR